MPGILDFLYHHFYQSIRLCGVSIPSSSRFFLSEGILSKMLNSNADTCCQRQCSGNRSRAHHKNVRKYPFASQFRALRYPQSDGFCLWGGGGGGGFSSTISAKIGIYAHPRKDCMRNRIITCAAVCMFVTASRLTSPKEK
jgi:hypothetical protein